jgi:hypothetical protein
LKKEVQGKAVEENKKGQRILPKLLTQRIHWLRLFLKNFDFGRSFEEGFQTFCRRWNKGLLSRCLSQWEVKTTLPMIFMLRFLFSVSIKNRFDPKLLMLKKMKILALKHPILN